MSKIIGVYPGSFDPVTRGHLDIIKRASRMVDKLIVGVAVNSAKNPLFTMEERIELTRIEMDKLPCLKDTETHIMPIHSLLIDFAASVDATIIIRGLRAVSDFDYEFKMSVMNARLNSKIETVFLMASEQHQFVSSMFVKEIGRLGGDISSFVTPHVNELLQERFKNMTRSG